MKDFFTMTFLVALFGAGVRMAVPLIYASVGDCFLEKAGAIGISIEGEMLFGSLFSYIVALKTGSLWLGVLAGGLAGMFVSLIPAIWSVLLKQDQSITGIMFNIFAAGFTNFLNRIVFGTNNANIAIATFPIVKIPLLSKIPFIGPVFFEQSLLTYGAVIFALIMFFVMKKTKLGLLLTSVGEDPKVAQSCGVNVYRFRILSYMFCGFAAGIGGASLVLGSVGAFSEGVTSGRGFICLAIVILARWNPLVAVLASFTFGSIEALQIRLQVMGSSLPFQFFVALPYLITIVVLAIGGRNLRAPKELGLPFDKESR
ncbi:MAG: ABC transporter permease [Erysipelotrichaceae bacterium]|nr:ABC transporter permease [Erysipelotrichaceae bacterium]